MRMWIRMQAVMFMFNFLNVNAASRVLMHFKLLLPRVRLSACPVVQLSVCPFVRLASVDMPSKFAMLLATHNFPCTLSGQEEELISILVCCFLRHHRDYLAFFPHPSTGSYDLWFVDFSHSTLHRFLACPPSKNPLPSQRSATQSLWSRCHPSRFQSFSWQLALAGAIAAYLF